jgi:hypothetical protein
MDMAGNRFTVAIVNGHLSPLLISAVQLFRFIK